MPSSEKTENLGLNLWAGSDKPKRDDFIRDNIIIDLAVQDKANLSAPGATNWDSGNFIVDSGVWTPTIKGGTTAGSFTYIRQIGSYVRQGRFVHVYCDIAATKTSNPVGAIRIAGLPFSATTNSVLQILLFNGITSASHTMLTASVTSGSKEIGFILCSPQGVDASTLSATHIGASISVSFAGIYAI